MKSVYFQWPPQVWTGSVDSLLLPLEGAEPVGQLHELELIILTPAWVDEPDLSSYAGRALLTGHQLTDPSAIHPGNVPEVDEDALDTLAVPP